MHFLRSESNLDSLKTHVTRVEKVDIYICMSNKSLGNSLAYLNLCGYFIEELLLYDVLCQKRNTLTL